MAKTPGTRTRGAWTISEHLDQGYSLTAYCNNPRCGRSKRRQGRWLDLRKLDPDLTLDELVRIDHVFVTHSHLDHVASIPFLLDTVAHAERRKQHHCTRIIPMRVTKIVRVRRIW